jgi:hypothetical protein
MLAKVIALLFITLSTILMTILILMNGWGLEPRSWGWIIIGNLVQMALVGLSQIVVKADQ